MTLRIFTLIGTLFWSTSYVGALEVPENLSQFELDNGLKIIVIENHRAPIVNHTLWYDVGASDDPPGKSGLTHFVEHLMFEGTKNTEAGEFDNRIKLMGGFNNAFTNQEGSAYTVEVSTEYLEQVMELEADRMVNLTFKPELVLRERDVILEERKERVDSSPSSLLREQMSATLFQNHPYGIPTIGWEHEMRSLTLEDAKSFYKKYYHPKNATLVISGDVYPDQVLELAKKYYGHLESPDDFERSPKLLEPPHMAERRVWFKDPRVSTEYVFRKYHVPTKIASDEENLAALALMVEVLGGSGKTSVLGEKLTVEEKIATYTGAGLIGDVTRPVVINMYVVPAQGVSLEEAEAKMDEVIAGFLEEGVDKDHLDHIKKQIKYSRIYAQDDAKNAAMEYGYGFVNGLTVEQTAAWTDQLLNTDEESVQEAAEILLSKNNSVTGWLLKEVTEQ
ncbi:MAG: pitrilysin family protein [Paracoccaceae bacterium]|nr:pitrilysin family protein [Paracoccaceae bacterium]